MPDEKELRQLAAEVRQKMAEPDAELRLRELRKKVDEFSSGLAQKLRVNPEEREVRVTL